MAAFLTVETVYSPFENAEELSRQSDIKYGAVKGGSTENFFRESKIDTYRRMWQSMQNSENIWTRNNSEGIQRIRQAAGKYAYLMESVSLEYIVRGPLNKDCDLRQVGGLLDSKGYGIATQRESPYRDVLSMAILQLQENDRLQLLFNKWWKTSGTCVSSENRPKVLGTQNIGGIFAILLLGLVISMLILAAEVTWYARRKHPDDSRPFVRRLSENFKIQSTMKSRVSRPSLSKSLTRDSIAKTESNLGSVKPVEMPLMFKARRSKSLHDDSTPAKRLEIMQWQGIEMVQAKEESRENDIDSDEYSQQLIKTGGLISSLSPKSRTNAIGILEDLSKQKKKLRKAQSTKPRLSTSSSVTRPVFDGDERFPQVSFRPMPKIKTSDVKEDEV